MAALQKIFGLEFSDPAAIIGGTGHGVGEESTMLESSPTWRSNFIPRDAQIKMSAMEQYSAGIAGTVTPSCAYKIASNVYFRIAVNCIILINAAQMGMAADYKGEEWDRVWDVCDYFFTAVFTVEMLLNVAGLKFHYFLDPWNLLDFVVVIVAIVDSFILKIALKQDGNALGATRVFRLLRLLRLLKIMHVVPELMMVVEGIIASLKSMMWIFMLLLVVLYTAGIFCVEVIGAEQSDYPARHETDEIIKEVVVGDFNNYLYFGTVLRSMISLFNLVLLDEWADIVRPVFEVQRFMTLFFIGLAVLCSFGILNVIIGVVVERTTRAMSVMRNAQVERLKRRQMKQVTSLAFVMFQLDEDKNGRLSQEEFEKGCDHPELVEMLSLLELPTAFTFTELFQALDLDGNGSLCKAEFIDGVMRLVYNTDFQRDCMFSCAFGQLRQGTVKMEIELKAELQAFAEDIRRDLEQLRLELRAAAAVKGCLEESCKVPADFKTMTASTDNCATPAVLLGEEQLASKVPSQSNPAVGASADSRGVENGSSADAVRAESIWEPLQMLMTPMSLLRTQPQVLSSPMDEVATSERCTASGLSDQDIVSALPAASRPQSPAAARTATNFSQRQAPQHSDLCAGSAVWL